MNTDEHGSLNFNRVFHPKDECREKNSVLFFLAAWVVQSAWALPTPGVKEVGTIPRYSPAKPYSFQVTTRSLYGKNHPVESDLVFFKEGKRRWEDKENCPFGKSLLDQETGRVFCELEVPPTGKIKVYSRSGAKLMEIQGRLWAVSNGGDFMAYGVTVSEEGPGGPAVFVVKVGSSKARKLQLMGNFVPKALSRDGRLVLLGDEKSDPSRMTYRLVDEQGTGLWGRSGQGRFEGLEGNGKWVLFVKAREKVVDYCDFQTGKSLNEMPFWKFNALHNPAPQPPPAR